MLRVTPLTYCQHLRSEFDYALSYDIVVWLEGNVSVCFDIKLRLIISPIGNDLTCLLYKDIIENIIGNSIITCFNYC